MGLENRTYWREPGGGYGGGGGGMMRGLTMGLPRPSPAVKWLLVINVCVFILQQFMDQQSPQYPSRPGPISATLGVTVGEFWQPWRYITFQFLHGGGWHIVLNMLGVYFFGTPLERKWGARRFLVFYLSCGVVAGVAYVIIGALFGLPDWMPIIGASGGVYAILLACAIFFPQFRVIFLFFPVPIRLAAVIVFSLMVLTVLRGLSQGQATTAMSDVAHLGGAVAAAVWVWLLPGLRQAGTEARAKANRGVWERKIRERQAEQEMIDHVLEKIQREGIASLTGREKKILQNATERQRREDQRINKL